MARYGILTADFDPPADFHTAFASAALEQYRLDQVYFVPCHTKRRGAAPEALRSAMCVQAIGGIRGLVLSTAQESTARPVQALAVSIAQTGGSAVLLSEKAPAWLKETGAHHVPFHWKKKEASLRAQIGACRDPEGVNAGTLGIIAREGLYQPCDEAVLKQMMGKHRFEHTMGVRQTAVELALRCGAPVIPAAVAAFYHDCAKELSLRDLRKLCISGLGIPEDSEILSSNALMHGPAGAVLARDRFGIRDESILSAIRYHTTGRVGMTVEDMVIFLADAIEPGREAYPGLERIRELAGVSLPGAVLCSLYCTRKYVLETGRVFHSSGEETVKWLESRCTPEEIKAAQSVE